MHPPDIEHADLAAIETTLARLQRRFIRLTWLGLCGFAAFFALGFAWGWTLRAETLDGRSIYVIDGDTVRLPGGETVRLHNIDAPETLRAKCEAEAALGFRAKARLAQLLRAAGPRVEISRCDGSRCTDRYGRTLARLTLPAGDAGEILITQGLATRWPTRRNWCGFERTR